MSAIRTWIEGYGATTRLESAPCRAQTPRSHLRPVAADVRNWLLLALAVLAAVTVYSLFQGRGAGARWTGRLSLLAIVSIACDARVRNQLAGAWREICSAGEDRAKLPWRAALLLVAIPDLLLLLSHAPGIQTGDSRPLVLSAVSLVADGDVELSEFAEFYRRHHYLPAGQELPYFLAPSPTGVYSQYPSGMLPFALPVVGVASLSQADLKHPIVQQHLEQLASALVAAACTALFFLLAWSLVPPAAALTATVLLAVGSVMYSTVGQALWQHGGVIVWTEVLLLIEFRAWRRPTWAASTAQGLAMAMMMACRLSAGVIVATFGLWVLVRSPVRASKLAGVATVAFLPWMLFHWFAYENIGGPMVVQTHGHLWSFGTMASWVGILVSPAHGLLVYQPWAFLLLATPWTTSCCSHGKTTAPPGWRLWAGSVIILHLSLISGWWCWWGGFCWGSRLASEAVPLTLLLCLGPIAALLQSRSGLTAISALLLVSALLHVPSVWLNQHRWYDGMDAAAQEATAWQWWSPPFAYPFRPVLPGASGER